MRTPPALCTLIAMKEGMASSVSTLMALVFMAGVVVQVNDPDPLPWMAIYGAAAGVTALGAIRGTVPVSAPLVVGIVALGWGAAVVAGGPNLDAYGRMFDAWEMDSAATEMAREGIGLLLIATWMAVLARTSWSERRGRRQRVHTEERTNGGERSG